MPRLTTFTRPGPGPGADLVFDVRDAGPEDGPVVILLHGFPERATSWDEVARLLHADGYRTLAPDQRGYSPGARPRGRRAYAVQHLVGDVEALRLAAVDAGADAERVHLVGHDWGAVVAWGFAGQHPERLRSLCAVSVGHTAAFLRSWLGPQLLRSWYMFLFQLPLLPELLARRPGGPLDHLLSRAGMSPEQVQRTRAEVVAHGALPHALGWYRAIGLAPPGWLRATVPVPTTMVWSDQDTACGRAQAERSARWVTGPFRLEVLEGVSHWVPEQAPERLAPLLLERFRSVEHGEGFA